MIEQLILTVVVLICFGILTYVQPPINNPLVQWGIKAIAALIAVLIILRIWGIGL